MGDVLNQFRPESLEQLALASDGLAGVRLDAGGDAQRGSRQIESARQDVQLGDLEELFKYSSDQSSAASVHPRSCNTELTSSPSLFAGRGLVLSVRGR